MSFLPLVMFIVIMAMSYYSMRYLIVQQIGGEQFSGVLPIVTLIAASSIPASIVWLISHIIPILN